MRRIRFEIARRAEGLTMAAVAPEGCSSNFLEADSAGGLNRHRSNSIGRLRSTGAFWDSIEAKTAGAERPPSAAQARERQFRDALAESDMFGALADAELDRLLEQGRIATYRADAPVFRRGDAAEELMIVLHGRIKLSSTSSKGRDLLFDFIEPGHCFGEFALLERRTRKLDATAVKPSAVFALRRRHMLACIEGHPEVAVRLIRVLCARLSRAMEMFEDRAQLGLPSRSARTLLRLASEHGNGKRIDLKISQTEIAGLVGATREKVNRQLCAWCRCGILDLDDGHLTILDQRALRAIAEDDPGPLNC
jgi:CRP/FNR family transcriptional regulator, cyclic AMP receptor protein